MKLKILLFTLILALPFTGNAQITLTTPGLTSVANTDTGAVALLDFTILGDLYVTGTTRLASNLLISSTIGEQLQLGAGSDAIPELSSSGDSNTGIRFPGSGVITFVEDGVEKARFSGGKLGIGTTNPANPLDVTGIISSSATIFATIFTPSIGFYSTNNNTNLNYRAGSSTAGTGHYFQDRNGGDIAVFRSDTKMVGIGTTAPGAKLSIVGGANPLNIWYDRNEATTKDSIALSIVNGNVGIGLTNPTVGFYSAATSNYFANTINTSGNFGVKTTSSGADYYSIHSTNLIEWGPGNSTYDVILKRESTGKASFTGSLGIGTTAPGAKLHEAGVSPTFIIEDTTKENSSGGRDSYIKFYGNKSDGTQHALSSITSSHYGTGDDTYSIMQLNLNDGDDGTSPTKYFLKASYAPAVGNLFTEIYGGTSSVATRIAINTNQTEATSQYLLIDHYNDIASGDFVAIKQQNANAELTASSGVQSFVTIEPEIAQTGTAGYTALKINSTETTVGSGAKYLIDAQVATVSKFNVSNTGIITRTNESNNSFVVSLDDAGEWVAPTGIAGKGYVQTDVEYATFTFLADGTVSMVAASTSGLSSANVTTTNDNDGTLNVYDGGSGIVVENQLGSTKNVMIILDYFTP